MARRPVDDAPCERLPLVSTPAPTAKTAPVSELPLPGLVNVKTVLTAPSPEPLNRALSTVVVQPSGYGRRSYSLARRRPMGCGPKRADTGGCTRRCAGAMEAQAMIALRIAAVVLVVSGVLALLFGGPGETEAALETVSLSVWAGVAAILIGNTLLLLTRPKH